jgi:hypothetical protein
MPGAIGRSAQVLSPGGGIKVAQPIQLAGFYWSGFLCLGLAVLKLTLERHWSWWRVLLPLWVVLGHNILYLSVGFVWLSLLHDGATESRSAKSIVGIVTSSGMLSHFRG